MMKSTSMADAAAIAYSSAKKEFGSNIGNKKDCYRSVAISKRHSCLIENILEFCYKSPEKRENSQN